MWGSERGLQKQKRTKRIFLSFQRQGNFIFSIPIKWALIFPHQLIIFPHYLEIYVVKKTKYPFQLLLFLSPFLLIITVHLLFCNAKTRIKHLFCLTSNPSTQHTPRYPSKPPQLQTIKHKSSKHTHNQTQVNVETHQSDSQNLKIPIKSNSQNNNQINLRV